MTRHDTEHPYELISAFADGEAMPAERDFVESHLKACAECRTMLEDLRRLSSAVAGEEAPPVPADLAARIRWRLKSAGPSSERRPRRRAWLSPIPMSTAAGLLVAVAVVWVLRGEYRLSSFEQRPPSPVLGQKVSESPMPQESLKKKRMKEIPEQGLLALVPQDAPDDTLVLDERVLEPQLAPEDILLLDGHVAKVFVRSGDGELNQAAEHILSAPEPPPARQSTLRKIQSPQKKPEPVESGENRVGRRNLEESEQLEVQERYSLSRRRDSEDWQIAPNQIAGEVDVDRAFQMMSRAISTGTTSAMAMLSAAPSYNVWLTETGQVSITAGSYTCSVQMEPPTANVTESGGTSAQAEVKAIFARASSIEETRNGAGAGEQMASDLYAVILSERRIFLIDAAGNTLDGFDLSGPDVPDGLLEIETRVLRLLREQMRSSLEKRCGPLPDLKPSGD